MRKMKGVASLVDASGADQARCDTRLFCMYLARSGLLKFS